MRFGWRFLPPAIAPLIVMALFFNGCLAKDTTNTLSTYEHASPMGVGGADESASEIDIKNGADQPQNELDSAQMLETALITTEEATKSWQAGNQDDALIKLDQAYQLLLQIPDEDSTEIIQGKDNLRLLISRRIVEVYASRGTTAGSIERSIPLVENEHVQREIKSFQTWERDFFLAAYQRSGRYRPMILEALRKAGMPEQLSWLPLIESGFKSNALSTARALGMWQFIPSTGYRYNLNRDDWVDERMDPEKATAAALTYMLEMHDMFGDWYSVLAGYNCGEARVARVIKNQSVNYMDNFWDLYEKLPNETARYVPRFIATLLIIGDPDKYGFVLPEPDAPIETATIEIDRPVKLADLEGSLGLAKDSLRWLNPELRHQVTPDRVYNLKVPSEVVETAVAVIENLPTWEIPHEETGYHLVRPGETLSVIARKYGIAPKKLMAANKLRNRNVVQVGQRLMIPGRKVAASSGRSESSKPADSVSKVTTSHKVKRGESLWSIAQLHGTSVDQVKALNHLRTNHVEVGMELTVRQSEGKPRASVRTYQVRRGDTLARIAERHKVSLSELMRVNNLSDEKIYPRQTLKLP